MIDAKKLFQSGRRYRGFAPLEGAYIPVTLNLYPLNEKELRIRYLLPLKVFENLKKGDTLYILIENERKMIAEIRVVSKSEKHLTTEVDFVTEDRRKLPRIRVKDLLEVRVQIECLEKSYEGSLIDLSMSSLGIDVELPKGVCDIHIIYGGRKIKVRGEVVRSEKGKTAVKITEGNELIDLLSRIYSDLFIKAQRG